MRLGKAMKSFVFLLVSGVALAHPPEGERPHGPPPPPHAVLIHEADDLGLDAETVARLEALVDESGVRELAEELHRTEKELVDSMLAELTPAQREAAKAVLPPPPPEGRSGPPPKPRR